MTLEVDADARVPQLRRQAGVDQTRALEQPSRQEALELKPSVEGFRGDSDGGDAGVGSGGETGVGMTGSDEARKRGAGHNEATEYDEEDDDEEDDDEEDGDEEGEGDGSRGEHGGRGGGGSKGGSAQAPGGGSGTGQRRRGGTPAEKEHKRLKRLLRNRVSAQQARERRKVYLAELETRSNQLEQRNAELKERLSTLQRENLMLRQVARSAAGMDAS